MRSRTTFDRTTADRIRTLLARTRNACIGSTRFRIEAHEAPVSEFLRQPSRKDGLGLMCAPHWKAYVKGLREARSSGEKAPAEPVATTEAEPEAAGAETAPAKASTKRERRRTPMAHVPAEERGGSAAEADTA